ncbi:MAG: hypothetical protein AAFY29_21555 [Pseudomonadota bacterium]
MQPWERHSRQEIPGLRLVCGSFATLLALGAPQLHADPCGSSESRLRPGDSTAVSYTAKPHAPGYRFSLGGVYWELQKATVTDTSGSRSFSVVYPHLLASSGDFASRDFFLSIQSSESDAFDCNDIPDPDPRADDRWILDKTLYVTDQYRSQLRPGAFTDSMSQLETMRTLATSLRVREAGFEVVVATGFASTQSMDLGACLNAPGDTLGIVENQPGEIHISCYPADETNDYVSNIDWTVDYHWPRNPSALIDDLIDYVQVEVHVEALP